MRTHESKSSLNLLACPARYWGRYVAGEPDPAGDAAIIGGAAHKALESGIKGALAWEDDIPVVDDKAFDRHLLDNGVNPLLAVEVLATLPRYLAWMWQQLEIIDGVEENIHTQYGVRAILDVYGRANGVPTAIDHKSCRHVPDAEEVYTDWQTVTTAAALYQTFPDAELVAITYGYTRYPGCNRTCLIDRARFESWLPRLESALELARNIQRQAERPAPMPGKLCTYCPKLLNCAESATEATTAEEMARLHILYSEAAKRAKAACKKLAGDTESTLWTYKRTDRLSADVHAVCGRLLDADLDPAHYLNINTEGCRRLIDEGYGELVQVKQSVAFEVLK